MASIDTEHLDFDYPVYDLRSRSIKLAISRQMVGGALSDLGSHITVNALRNINLSINEGDRLGLVGHNGAGKSTLLRVVAGLYRPQRGRIRILGRVVPLVEKGVGISWDDTGYDNIELPLRLLGATNEEVKRAKKDIPEFTGLGAYMHLPLRTYSDGMKARFAFALCTAIEADILVLDEWLSAGDLDFQERANQRLNELVRSASILVLASHSLPLIESVCNRAILLEKGRIVLQGGASEVCAAYLNDDYGEPTPPLEFAF
ncbi:MAG TPA: ABC transporter [Hyphomonadaceae bacterium]|nr:ABC transporter [Hyphomonadaceae bacterium]